MFCMNCGRTLPDGAKFCKFCGTHQDAVTPTAPVHSEPINLDGTHTFVPAMCPNCNANMKVDSSSKIAHCNSCGTECLVQDAIKALTVRGNVQVGNATINVNGTNTESLLKRVEIMLADGDFIGAREKCDVILDSDPTNAKVYIAMLMAVLSVRRQDELANCRQPFDKNSFYLKAMQFGDEETKARLVGYIKQIKERKKNEHLNGIYEQAVKTMRLAHSEEDYLRAIALFKSISDFKDSNERIEECLRKIEEIKAVAIKRKEKAAEISRIEKEKSKKRFRIFGIALLLFFAIALLTSLTKSTVSKQKLNKAMKLLDSGDYEAAYALLEDIGNSDAIASSKYDRAMAWINSGDYEMAYELLNGLDYNDSAYKLRLVNEKISLPKAQVGSYVYFGSYEQDNNTSNGTEDIEWLVLAREDDRVLLISRYALDRQDYNTSFTDVTWESCSLRTWLNGTFLSEAFSEEERAMIPSANVSADKNPSYSSTEPGNSTMDQVFLLSFTEVNMYFDSQEARECTPTSYAVQKLLTRDSNCWWWLRSPGYNPDRAVIVNYDGRVNADGIYVDTGHGVRPAIWVKLD